MGELYRKTQWPKKALVVADPSIGHKVQKTRRYAQRRGHVQPETNHNVLLALLAGEANFVEDLNEEGNRSTLKTARDYVS